MDNSNFYTIQGYMIKDLKLSGNELIVFAIINGFSQDNISTFNGSLQYFCEWTNASKRTIQNTLNSLIEKDLIKKQVDIINGVKICRYSKNCYGGIAKIATPIENKENLTKKNKKYKVIINNNNDIVARATTANDFEIIKQIIDYLNQAVGGRYTTKNKATISHIKARLSEGFSLNDFITVIDKKTREWLNTKMAIYLRPETLFSNKFESYLNQVENLSTSNLSIDDILNNL